MEFGITKVNSNQVSNGVCHNESKLQLGLTWSLLWQKVNSISCSWDRYILKQTRKKWTLNICNFIRKEKINSKLGLWNTNTCSCDPLAHFMLSSTLSLSHTWTGNQFGVCFHPLEVARLLWLPAFWTHSLCPLLSKSQVTGAFLFLFGRTSHTFMFCLYVCPGLFRRCYLFLEFF